jgi:hypothetical protein
MGVIYTVTSETSFIGEQYEMELIGDYQLPTDTNPII